MLKNSLSKGMYAKALHSAGLAATPAGAEMVEALRHPLGTRFGGQAVSYVVRAEPEAWDALRVWALYRSVTEPGDYNDANLEAAGFRRLATRLNSDLNRLAAHPGYRGLAVVGTVTTELPARRKVGDDRWWPTLNLALASTRGDSGQIEVALLKPEVVRLRRRVFTTWKPEPSPLEEARSILQP